MTINWIKLKMELLSYLPKMDNKEFKVNQIIQIIKENIERKVE